MTPTSTSTATSKAAAVTTRNQHAAGAHPEGPDPDQAMNVTDRQRKVKKKQQHDKKKKDKDEEWDEEEERGQGKKKKPSLKANQRKQPPKTNNEDKPKDHFDLDENFDNPDKNKDDKEGQNPPPGGSGGGSGGDPPGGDPSDDNEDDDDKKKKKKVKLVKSKTAEEARIRTVLTHNGFTKQAAATMTTFLGMKEWEVFGYLADNEITNLCKILCKSHHVSPIAEQNLKFMSFQIKHFKRTSNEVKPSLLIPAHTRKLKPLRDAEAGTITDPEAPELDERNWPKNIETIHL